MSFRSSFIGHPSPKLILLCRNLTLTAFSGQKSGSRDFGDPLTSNLSVINLPGDISEQALGTFFSQWGDIATVKVSDSRSDLLAPLLSKLPDFESTQFLTDHVAERRFKRHDWWSRSWNDSVQTDKIGRTDGLRQLYE